MTQIIKLAVIATILIVSTNGWWQVGHMLTAQVALLDLMSRNQTIVDEANRLIKALNPLSSNKSQDFVQSASWMDDIKTPSTNYWDFWHYMDLPINNDGLYIFYDYISSVYNSVNAMHRISNVFSNYTIGEQVTMERAMMLRMMIHIVGDMHQPLHNTNYFNGTYHTPSGDIAGNAINITNLQGDIMNLHAYWDSGALMLNKDPTFLLRPLTEEQKEYIQNWGRDIMTQHTRESLADRLSQEEPYKWNRESQEISKNFIYPWIETHNTVDEKFQNDCRSIIEVQIAVGGYRLADFMFKALNGEFHLPNSYEAPQPNNQIKAENRNGNDAVQQVIKVHEEGFLPQSSGN